MANRSRKLKPQSTPQRSSKRISSKSPPKSRSTGWLGSILAFALLLSSAALVLGFLWISILFIFNPEQVGWVNEFLPESWQIPFNPSEPSQTFNQIQDNLSQNQIAGETLALDKEGDSFLLPILQQRVNCQSDCLEIVELRVYQRSKNSEFQSQLENYYNLATQVTITAPEESLIDAKLEHQDSNTLLPLTKINLFADSAPSPGIWLALWGQRPQENRAIAYGYIVYYNPQRSNLQQLLAWHNPNGQLPEWQQVTGAETKELVIDQTIGLEPQVKVYQVQATNFFLNPFQLTEIVLTSPAINDSAFSDALFIARNGLWTPAWEWLQFMQKQRPAGFPTAAQAQVDLIRLHSQLTKAQAQISWASPSQQVLAELIDGRWAKALQVLTASPHNSQEIATLLKADTGRLWNRTVAALKVNPHRQDVQAWAALILAAKHGEGRANAWLQSQSQITSENLTYVQGFLVQLNGGAKPKIAAYHPSQIVGMVQPISQIKSSEWLQLNSNTDLQLTDQQIWYRVEVSNFHDGKNWLSSPFKNLQPPKTSPAQFFWQTLGINTNPEIQIIVWQPDEEQQITSATIKGVRWHNGTLQLLATGQAIPGKYHSQQPKPLALTAATLEWVQPSPVTFTQLYQQNPQAVDSILPIIWRSLQTTGQIPGGDVPQFPDVQAQLGDWPLQKIDLTNNTQPETVLTISADAIAALQHSNAETQELPQNSARPRTLILSDNGKIVYTDFQKNSQQLLTAIAKLSDGKSLALLVENTHNYSLRRWSQKNQRFE